MRARPLILALVAAALLILFAYTVRQLSFVSLGFAANREMQASLRRSLEDQKRLAALDPAREREYRDRFRETSTLLERIEVLAFTRRNIARQFELVLIGLVAAILLAGTAAFLLERRRRERRLADLARALHALSLGEANVAVADRGRDVIGRFARMIEETSAAMGRERRRVQYLEHLASWQEAARRHAHEIRTPLTAVHLEVARLLQTVQERLPESAREWEDAESSIHEELELLRTFTTNFVSFATVAAPRMEPRDLAEVVRELCATFGPNWPAMTLSFEDDGRPHRAQLDRDLLRQVLVNLCQNSSLAGAHHIRFALRNSETNVILDVADDGAGIAPDVKKRLFEPYVTTRKIGEGMGLGLAISKKILLDHGGDLELIDSPRGATFRLTLLRAEVTS